ASVPPPRRGRERTKRDPMSIVPAKMIVCLLGERDEIAEMLRQPLVKAYALQLTAESLRVRVYRHPMGDHWRGIQDIEPDKLTPERLLSSLEPVAVGAPLASVPHGTPKEGASEIKALDDAGLRVASILD